MNWMSHWTQKNSLKNDLQCIGYTRILLYLTYAYYIPLYRLYLSMLTKDGFKLFTPKRIERVNTILRLLCENIVAYTLGSDSASRNSIKVR